MSGIERKSKMSEYRITTVYQVYEKGSKNPILTTKNKEVAEKLLKSYNQPDLATNHQLPLIQPDTPTSPDIAVTAQPQLDDFGSAMKHYIITNRQSK
jgi:hypothetical protein